MALSLKLSRDGGAAPRGRPRARLWVTTSAVSAGVTLAQLLGAVLPGISRDYRDSGRASFVPIFIAFGFVLALLSGLIFGTAWWLALLGSAKIGNRATRGSLLVSVIAAAGVAAIAGGISAAIAPQLYTAIPLSSSWFDFISVALVTGATTAWLLLKSKFALSS